MNNIIRKYKDKVINLQSSRKLVRIESIIYCIIIIMTICTIILCIKTNHPEGQGLWGIAVIIIGLFCFYLYKTDWSVKNANNILYVRKWIFTHEIPYKDLIDIKQSSELIHRSNFHWYEYLSITYKKGKKIKQIKMDYLSDAPFFKFEYVKESQIIEFINTFLKSGELIENNKESNVLLSEYKNIRTEQEEKEIDNILNKGKNNEEKVIWIGICLFVTIFMIFLFIIFKISNK